MPTLFSVNVNGLNSPFKRSQCFHTLIKQKVDITCIQETHIKQKDMCLLEQSKLGKVYALASINEKKGE